MSPTLAGVAVGFAFGLGLIQGLRRGFPVSHLIVFRNRLFVTSAPEDEVAPRGISVTLKTRGDVATMRRAITEVVAGSGASPEDMGGLEPCDVPTPLADIKGAIRTEAGRRLMSHGVDSIVTFLHPSQPSGIAAIYHQGHEGGAECGRKHIEACLAEGFLVAAMAMPLLGPNAQPTVAIPPFGDVTLRDHDFFWLFEASGLGHGLRYFVEPVFTTVNHLLGLGITKIAMFGASGGGWTTTIAAALDPRIGFSVPVAGSLPFGLRRKGEMSDYENHHPALYSVADLPDLHVLGGTGDRMQLQILNRYDPVVWSGDRGRMYADLVAQGIREIDDGGEFEIHIDESWAQHGISPRSMKMIIRQTKTFFNRRDGGASDTA